MTNKILFAFALSIFAFACDDGDNVPEKTFLLKLTVDASYTTDRSDNWIIVHGEDGSLLASESFETNQVLEVQTDKPAPGKITVTHLWHNVSNGNKYYTAKSHVNIEKGKHMILKLPSVSIPPKETEKLHVSVSNVASYDHCTMSKGSLSVSWNGGILNMTSPIYAGLSKWIVTVSDGYSLKHKVLNNVKPNDSYSFFFYDMSPFDQTVDFTFPQSDNVTLLVWGSEPGTTLTNDHSLLLHAGRPHTHSTIKAGYLNSLTNYSTRLFISYPGYRYDYGHIGSIPDGNIAWPQKSDFNISEKSFTNFSATSSKSYVMRLSTWNYSGPGSNTVIAWDVSAASGNQYILELPPEITSVHPTLSFSNMKHASTTFFTQSLPFESIVDKYFESDRRQEGSWLGIRIETK